MKKQCFAITAMLLCGLFCSHAMSSACSGEKQGASQNDPSEEIKGQSHSMDQGQSTANSQVMSIGGEENAIIETQKKLLIEIQHLTKERLEMPDLTKTRKELWENISAHQHKAFSQLMVGDQNQEQTVSIEDALSIEDSKGRISKLLEENSRLEKEIAILKKNIVESKSLEKFLQCLDDPLRTNARNRSNELFEQRALLKATESKGQAHPALLIEKENGYFHFVMSEIKDMMREDQRREEMTKAYLQYHYH